MGKMCTCKNPKRAYTNGWGNIFCKCDRIIAFTEAEYKKKLRDQSEVKN